MDSSLANDINRRDARIIAEYLDTLDPEGRTYFGEDWFETAAADIMLRNDDGTNPDRAFWLGLWAQKAPGLYFDGAPADCDWENLYSHLRAEILARRAPETPHARTPETQPCGVV